MIRIALLALAVASAPPPADGQRSALQIRVLAGEGIVNVIQQKTAAAPVVEVLDRNGLPVAGASVTFSIVGATLAAFPDNATAFTVVTDAQGQATSAAITPLAPGTFAVRVQAAFQGQTSAVTIAQTNVATTAKAVAATQAPPPVPIGGKGISKRALGIVGAAVIGGGAVAATQLQGDTVPTPVSTEPAVIARSFRLTGTFTATMVHSIGGVDGGSPCVMEHAVRLDMISSLTFVGNTLTNTSFSTSAADSPSSSTCVVTQAIASAPVVSGVMTGTPSALSFRFARNYNQAPDNGVLDLIDLTHEFTGVYDGTTVVGTYTFDRRITRTAAGGVRQETVSRMSLPVTLR